ncbi:MAG: hypothetical protein ACI4EI_00710 [Muricoprocola sp.]
MDKYEYQAKLEEINKLVEKKEYEEAVSLVDTIEWKRVRSVRTLCMVSELYEAVGRVEDSKAILYRAYRRSPNSRQILFRLVEACILNQEFDDAVEYYTEYVNLAPNDNNKYILKYEIYRGRGSSVEEQISVLEELKSKEYTEQWAYELAKLYDEAGMADKCVAECDDIALWFHSGKYVVGALELKKKYVPLTPEQQTIYENPSEIIDMETKEEVIEKAVPTLDEEIMKEMPKSEKEVITDSILMNTEKEIAASVIEHKEESQQEAAKTSEQKQAAEKKFNTVELQNELASSMREILAGIKSAPQVEELENIPFYMQMKKEVEEKTRLPEEAVPVKGANQITIDDILTGDTEKEEISEELPSEMIQEEEILDEPVEEEKETDTQQETEKEQDILTAATINLSDTIKKEIGDRNLREYASARAAEERKVEEPVKETGEEVPAERKKVNPMSYTRDGLDGKEKMMLGFWGTIRGISEQVNAAVTQIMRSALTDKTSARGNVILVGDAGNGRTTLAIALAKIVCRCKGGQTVKVAKIYAEDLNNKDIAATVNKIAGGVLIIEEAGDLSDAAIASLSMAMSFKTDSLVIVLEDERRYLQELLARSPEFAQKFDITINVPMLTNDELVEFGKYYALQNDSVLDESGVAALYEKIGDLQTPEQPAVILDVKEIMDKVIKKAEKFSIGKLVSTVSGKRYDEEDRIVLKDKYFKKVK